MPLTLCVAMEFLCNGKKGIKIPRLQFNCLAFEMVTYFGGVVKVIFYNLHFTRGTKYGIINQLIIP